MDKGEISKVVLGFRNFGYVKHAQTVNEDPHQRERKFTYIVI